MTHENRTVSIIERTRVALPPVLSRAARAGDHSRNLDFRIQRQLHSNWCWAAVATSIALYYDPKRKWTQCGVANGNLRRRDCCGKSKNHKCNVTGHLRHVLRLVRHAKRPYEIKRKISFSDIEREIDAKRPLGVRTQWRGGGGHFLTIVGYHRELELLSVADPLFGRSHWHHGAFSKNYRHCGGEWKNSYYTKP